MLAPEAVDLQLQAKFRILPKYKVIFDKAIQSLNHTLRGTDLAYPIVL